MKYVWRIAFLALILIPVAQVHAEVTTVKKHQVARMRAFRNLNAHLEQLEAYSVIYVVGKKSETLRSTPARHMKKDDVTVELRAAKHKS